MRHMRARECECVLSFICYPAICGPKGQPAVVGFLDIRFSLAVDRSEECECEGGVSGQDVGRLVKGRLSSSK